MLKNTCRRGQRSARPGPYSLAGSFTRAAGTALELRRCHRGGCDNRDSQVRYRRFWWGPSGALMGLFGWVVEKIDVICLERYDACRVCMTQLRCNTKLQLVYYSLLGPACRFLPYLIQRLFSLPYSSKALTCYVWVLQVTYFFHPQKCCSLNRWKSSQKTLHRILFLKSTWQWLHLVSTLYSQFLDLVHQSTIQILYLECYSI